MTARRADRSRDGYRRRPGVGSAIRADVVDVYVFRRAARGGLGIELLQLRRAKPPLEGSWQPVMGHIERGETAVDTAQRELREEVGLRMGDAGFMGLWALEQVHPFYIAKIDCVVLSPRFAAMVTRAWRARLNHEHSAARWVPGRRVERDFMWPGQHAAIRELTSLLSARAAATRERLRIG